MQDKKVIILDETNDNEYSIEELEELERNQRLNKLKKPTLNVKMPYMLAISKIGNVIGLFGIMFSMLTVSGTALIISLVILLISTIVNYLFFK